MGRQHDRGSLYGREKKRNRAYIGRQKQSEAMICPSPEAISIARPWGKASWPNAQPGTTLQTLLEAGYRAARIAGKICDSNQGTLTARNRFAVTLPERRMVQLELSVIDSLSNNALAARQNDVHVAAVFDALAGTIASIALLIWSNPLVLPEIGDVSQLPAPPENSGDWSEHLTKIPLSAVLATHDPNLVAEWLADETSFRANLMEYRDQLIAKLCPVRHAAMVSTISDAMQYVWLHEIAHLVLGHVDSISSGNLCLAETESDDSSLSPELLKAFEYQADSFAFVSLFRNLETFPHLNKRQRILAGVVAAVVPQIIFWLKNSLQTDTRQCDTHHPPIWLRFKHAAIIANLAFGEARGGVLNEVFDGIVRAHPLIFGCLRDGMQSGVRSDLISYTDKLSSQLTPREKSVYDAGWRRMILIRAVSKR